MLVKKFLFSLLICLPLLAGAGSDNIRGGRFDDGTFLAYQCSSKASGDVLVVFVTVSGEKYTAMLSCGESI